MTICVAVIRWAVETEYGYVYICNGKLYFYETKTLMLIGVQLLIVKT